MPLKSIILVQLIYFLYLNFKMLIYIIKFKTWEIKTLICVHQPTQAVPQRRGASEGGPPYNSRGAPVPRPLTQREIKTAKIENVLFK